ncbi:hypothetical protein [Salmonella enterica]|uniref:hypothetical protein n=1 Tax=Salmonella enterica TaxID=28901 RepID=UPI003A8050E6
MSMKYITDVNAASQIKVQNKNTGLSITAGTGQVFNTNSSGEITFPVLTTDDVNYITSELPLSQYGELYDDNSLNITATGFNLTFNREIPLFMSGKYFKVPLQSIPLAPPSGGSYTYYIYVRLVLGEPIYTALRSEGQETETSMFIGTAIVSTTGITNINVNRVSRFNIYRPNVTQKGASFPVSTGHPAQSGTINW